MNKASDGSVSFQGLAFLRLHRIYPKRKRNRRGDMVEYRDDS